MARTTPPATLPIPTRIIPPVVGGGGGGGGGLGSTWAVWGYIDFRTLTPTTISADTTVDGIDFKRISGTSTLSAAAGWAGSAAGTWGLDLNTMPNGDSGLEANLGAYQEVAFITEGNDAFGTYTEQIGNWTAGGTGDHGDIVRNAGGIYPRVYRMVGGATLVNGLTVGDGAVEPFQRRCVIFEGMSSRFYYDSVAVDVEALPLNPENIGNVGTNAATLYKNVTANPGPGRGSTFDGTAMDQFRWTDDGNAGWDIYTLTVLARSVI